MTLTISQIIEIYKIRKAVILDRSGRKVATIRKGDRVNWELDAQKVRRMHQGFFKTTITLENRL